MKKMIIDHDTNIIRTVHDDLEKNQLLTGKIEDNRKVKAAVSF